MSEYVPRLLASKIEEEQKYYPVTVVTGPRQSGKTSLCRHLFPDYTYYNMEDVGVSSVTIGEWYSILQTGYICYSISPYYANISKRLTKMPKVYFYDTGLLCYLLGLMSPEGVAASPLRGAIFENFAMGELLKHRVNMALEPNLQFYREHSGREVDALINSDGLHLYEIKSAKTFRKEFTDNTDYLKGLLPDVRSVVVVYDGQTMSPFLINVRDI